MVVAKNLIQNKDISLEEFKERMLQARGIMEETIRILSLEPADSNKCDQVKFLQKCLSRIQEWSDSIEETNTIEYCVGW